MIVIHVIRKPCSEGSVGRNALKFGTGSLNIDQTRIQAGSAPQACVGTGWASQDKKNADHGFRPKAYYADQEGIAYTPSNLGRWPANLILQHLPDCRCTGTKAVKPHNGSGRSSVNSDGFRAEYVGGPPAKALGYIRGYSMGPGGTETVEAWECQEGCPVQWLDSLTDHLHAAVSVSRPKQYNATSYQVGDMEKQASFTDSGGASRFFKQVGGNPV